MKIIYVITGGTMVHISPHFSLCAPAYGSVGVNICRRLSRKISFQKLESRYGVCLIKTKMAGQNSKSVKTHLEELGAASPETNQDLQTLINTLVRYAETAAIVMAAAVCDFEPVELMATGDTDMKIIKFGKDQKRLHHIKSLTLQMRPSDKIIDQIKHTRPDIFLVTFKTTAGVDENEMLSQALYNLKRSKSNLVLANDVQKRQNMVVTSEGENRTAENRQIAVNILCEKLLASMLKTDSIRSDQNA
jgi:hypothetical protein